MLGTNHIEVRAICEHRGLFQGPLFGFAPLKSVSRFGIGFVILIVALPLLGKQVIFSQRYCVKNLEGLVLGAVMPDVEQVVQKEEGYRIQLGNFLSVVKAAHCSHSLGNSIAN